MGKHNNNQRNNTSTATKQDDLVTILEILEDLKILEKPENLETLLVMIDDVKSGKSPYSEKELREVLTATLLRLLDEDSTRMHDLSEQANKLDEVAPAPRLRNRAAHHTPTETVEKLVVVTQKWEKWADEIRPPRLENRVAHHTPTETVEKPVTIKKKSDVSVPKNHKKYLWASIVMPVTAAVLALSFLAALPILPIAPLSMMILGAFMLGSALVGAVLTSVFLVNAVSEKSISKNSVKSDNAYPGVPYIQMKDICDKPDFDLESYAWQPQSGSDQKTMETVPTTLTTNVSPARSWR